MLKIIGLTPHPPLIIPEVGRGEISKVEQTVTAMERLSRRIYEAAPERLIVITPHGPLQREGVAAIAAPLFEGDFCQFGAPEVKVSLETDRELLEQLQRETAGESLHTIVLETGGRRRHRLSMDHGAAVPLHYLQQAGLSCPGLHLTYTFAPYRELYRFGASLRRAIEKRGLPAAVVASGDLSHCLIPGAPAGYNPRGKEYDHLLVELLRRGRVEEILDLDEELVEDAGECALRSFVIALGALSGENFHTEILSYEGPFGVGYMVAEILPAKEEDSSSGSSMSKNGERPAGGDISGCSDPVTLARQALRYYLEHGRFPEAPDPLPEALSTPAGVFVSLKKGDELRGCIGTIEPLHPSLAGEIIANAISAGVKDPRFSPVSLEELDELTLSVDQLLPPDPIESEAALDPKIYGVIVRSGHRSGLLLPDLEGIETAAEQVAIARRKAGIGPGEKVELFRFKVRRYE